MDDFFTTNNWPVLAGIVIVLAVLIIAGLRWMAAPEPEPEPLMICPNCGNFGHTQKVLPGSELMCLFLLLFLIVPGIFYALWRQLNARQECPVCHQAGMVPHNSPRGLKLQGEFHTQK